MLKAFPFDEYSYYYYYYNNKGSFDSPSMEFDTKQFFFNLLQFYHMNNFRQLPIYKSPSTSTRKICRKNHVIFNLINTFCFCQNKKIS